jgi:hypothetical protein
VDLHHVDVDPDPNPTFNFDANPDPDPTPSFTHVGKNKKLTEMAAFIFCFLISVIGVIIFRILDSRCDFLEYSLSLHLAETWTVFWTRVRQNYANPTGSGSASLVYCPA